MTNAPTRTFYAWDNPESKIRFLETVMDGQEWQTNIHFPADDPSAMQKMQQVQQTLQRSGYRTSFQQDADGHAILHIHQLGDHADIRHLFRKEGLVSGTAYMATNPVSTAKFITQSITGGIKDLAHFVKDPARANGLFFLVAEGFLFKAAEGNRHGSSWDLKNGLQRLAATFWLSQSIAYLFVAEKGDERVLKDVNNQIKQASESGHAIDWSQAEITASKPVSGIVQKGIRWISDHPIETGAIMNNAGMIAHLGHAWLERKSHLKVLNKAANKLKNPGDWQAATDYIHKGGFAGDTSRGLMSLVAWSFLLKPSKEHPEKSDNPFKRLWQHAEENPNRVTAVGAFAASSAGLMGAIQKRNPYQQYGEITYLMGDAFLWFTKSDEYGHGSSSNKDTLYHNVAETIRQMPLVMSPDKEYEFVHGLANYLARQEAEMDRKKHYTPEDIERLAANYQDELITRIGSDHRDQFNHFAEMATNLTRTLKTLGSPHSDAHIAETLASLNGVELDDTSLQHILATAHTPSKTGSAPSPEEAIKSLVKSLPASYGADNAALLYDRLIRQQHKPADHAPLSTVSEIQAVARQQQLAQRPAL